MIRFTQAFVNGGADVPRARESGVLPCLLRDSPEWLRETSGNGYFDSLSGAGAEHILPGVVDTQLLRLEAAVSYRAGTSSAAILKSFATMVPWRKTSLPLSATTEWEKSGRRRRSTLVTWRGFYDRRAGAGEAYGGAKTEGGAGCAGAGIAAGSAGVAKQPLYPDNSRERHVICCYGGVAEIESLQCGAAQMKQRLVKAGTFISIQTPTAP